MWSRNHQRTRQEKRVWCPEMQRFQAKESTETTWYSESEMNQKKGKRSHHLPWGKRTETEPAIPWFPMGVRTCLFFLPCTTSDIDLFYFSCPSYHLITISSGSHLSRLAPIVALRNAEMKWRYRPVPMGLPRPVNSLVSLAPRPLLFPASHSTLHPIKKKNSSVIDHA